MRSIIAIFLLAYMSSLAHAQADWPRRKVKIFIGFSAGGNIAAVLVSESRPDGYTRPMASE